jgi:hypothetical protein
VLNYTPWGPRGWGCRATGPAINVNSSELRSNGLRYDGIMFEDRLVAQAFRPAFPTDHVGR